MEVLSLETQNRNLGGIRIFIFHRSLAGRWPGHNRRYLPLLQCIEGPSRTIHVSLSLCVYYFYFCVFVCLFIYISQNSKWFLKKIGHEGMVFVCVCFVFFP